MAATASGAPPLPVDAVTSLPFRIYERAMAGDVLGVRHASPVT